jgi:hypothetical protein
MPRILLSLLAADRMRGKPRTVRERRVREMKAREERPQEFRAAGKRELNCDGPVGGGEKGGKGEQKRGAGRRERKRGREGKNNEKEGGSERITKERAGGKG